MQALNAGIWQLYTKIIHAIMRNYYSILVGFILTIVFNSCEGTNENQDISFVKKPIEGTWRLLTGMLIEKGDTTVTDYTKNVSFIKIINESHFAFVQHDLKNGKDSAAIFSAGAGRYTLKDNTYTEFLEYCSAREWEGHDFSFTIELRGDTLIQSGVEKIDSLGVNRMNVEKYVRVNNK
jgi:hypothetical protein